MVNEKNFSINKLVACFKDEQLPKSNVAYNHNKDLRYEHYIISGSIIQNNIHLIYINRYTPQTKAVADIKSQDKIRDDDQVYVITDNVNKSGGEINATKIKKDFLDASLNAELYTIESFSHEKIYNNAFNVDLLHNGKFSISDFINPIAIESKKNVELLISEWIESEDAPLMVIKGSGGIGKTTVVKHYLDKLYQQKKGKINIIFINSHDLINNLNRSDKVSDIYDFYEAFIRINSEDNALSIKKNVFQLTIDHGNLIFVIDGIDEVLAKLGGKFHVNNLISSIFNEYSDTLSRAKVIFTCRDEFWSINDFEERIHSITLQPFTRLLAEEYFRKKFKDSSSKAKRAIALADEFALNRETREYVPYILDMIKESLLLENKSDGFPDTKILQPAIANDFLVGKTCDREIIKLGHKTIDEQLYFFIKLANKYDGSIKVSSVRNFFDISQNQVDIYKAHPLLIFDQQSEYLEFRYDFFVHYFKSIQTYFLLVGGEETAYVDISDEDKKIIIEVLSIDVNNNESIVKRLDVVDGAIEHIKNSLYLFVNDETKCRYDRNLSSCIFYLILTMLKNNSKDERTQLMKEIYLSPNGEVENLSLMNIYSTKNLKCIFNFSGVKFNKCHFENYEAFSECDFTMDTIFSNSNFIKPLFGDSTRVNFSRSNFNNCCDISSLEQKLTEIEEQGKERDGNLSRKVKYCIGSFWGNGRFKIKTADFVNKRMSKDYFVLESLVNAGVINEVKNTTSEKRMEKSYEVAESYKDELSKIMDQNSTNSAFLSIVKLIKCN